MPENSSHGSKDSSRLGSDGGTVTETPGDQRETGYLTEEVNLLKPSTPFMRDHLRVIWTGFVAWLLIVFGPVTATAIAPGLMTTQMPVLGFPLHYFLVAIGAPGGSLLLALWYTRKRDRLEEKYGIDHASVAEQPSEEVAAADGGVEQ